MKPKIVLTLVNGRTQCDILCRSHESILTLIVIAEHLEAQCSTTTTPWPHAASIRLIVIDSSGKNRAQYMLADSFVSNAIERIVELTDPPRK